MYNYNAFADKGWRRHYAFGLSVRPSVRPLTPISRDAVSLYLVKGFQRNLAQVFIM